MSKSDKPRISLTTFVDFVNKAGTPKITLVKEAKKRYAEDYDPHSDFWLRLRKAIIDMHRNDSDVSVLDSLLSNVKDANKLALYRDRIEGYKSILTRRGCKWAISKSCVFELEGLIVSVNPELVLLKGNKTYRVKLYFKNEKLINSRIVTAIRLMELAFESDASGGKPAILDLKGKTLHSPCTPDNITSLLIGEVKCFLTVWNDC